MINKQLQNFEARYERFIHDIALVFLFDILGLLFFILALVASDIILILMLGTISGVCYGISLGKKIIILYRILKRTKWKKA